MEHLIRRRWGATPLICVLVLSGCGGGGSPPSSPTVLSIAVLPAAPGTAAGTSVQLSATATYNDGSHADVTQKANWTSSNTSIATVGATTGTANGLTVGNATITAFCSVATLCGSLSGSTVLTVTAPALLSITVAPAAPSVVNGQQLQFVATGLYSDQSTQNLSAQATWSSANSSVATIGTSGLISALSPGNTAVTATLGKVSATTSLNIASGVWPVAVYEAESAQRTGGAVVVGAADRSDRSVGDLGGEASQRQAVVLTNTGDAVAWVVGPGEAGANALVVRYSIPDALGGGGVSGQVMLTIVDGAGNTQLQQSLQLTSRYSWLYGGVMDGTKLYNVPANASQYGTANTPTHLYDEIQLKLATALQPGYTITLSKTASSGVATIALDFMELETVPVALSQPAAFLSLMDPRCGAIPVDLRKTGAVFDGADDSSYGSVFNSVHGNNPGNPISFAVVEKDYYSTGPADALQDAAANSLTGGLSMFDLADHNLQSLNTCIGLVSAAGSGLSGVYVPPGRFYVRGVLALPSNVMLQGAGMWYTKFAAVDTAAPAAVTVRGVSGIASVSGNFVISSQTGGADHVRVANFSLFGNVTQRDIVDSIIPDGLRAEFTNGVIDNVWVEHTFSGLKTNLNSNAVLISNSRVRNTFADGIDFYGSTSNSSITNSTARSTGDDGFAMWSQGSTLAGTSQSNSIANSTAALQWYGNGFAVYGGNQMSISNSRASDILNYPCLQMSTQFVSSVLPSSASMSASASGLDFYRCGGNGFNQQFGAVLLGTDLQNVNGLSVSQVNISSPTYKAFEFRSFLAPPNHTVAATFSGVTIRNAEVLGGPACGAAGPYTGGSAQLVNVCTCASVTSAPSACPVSISGSSTLQITSNSCSAAQCVGF
jgi:hypothetical protein